MDIFMPNFLHLYADLLWNGETKLPQGGAGFAVAAEGVTRVTDGFSGLLGRKFSTFNEGSFLFCVVVVITLICFVAN